MLDIKSGLYGDNHYFHELYSGGQQFLVVSVILCGLCFFACCGHAHLKARGYNRAEDYHRYTFAETFSYVPRFCLKCLCMNKDIDKLPQNEDEQCCFWLGKRRKWKVGNWLKRTGSSKTQ